VETRCFSVQGEVPDSWQDRQAVQRTVNSSHFLDGTTTWTRRSKRIRFHRKRRPKYFNFISVTVINGQKLQNFLMAGNNDYYFRSDNCIKNYYYSTLRKHLRKINKDLRKGDVGSKLKL